MVESSSQGKIEYLSKRDNIDLSITLKQMASVWRQNQSLHRQMCLIIDNSGSMGEKPTDTSVSPIEKVRDVCAKLGEAFFRENGAQLTLIPFASTANSQSHSNYQSFKSQLDKLQGDAGQTRFSDPLNLL